MSTCALDGGERAVYDTLALPIQEMDDDVLSIVEGEVLGTTLINDLLALVADGQQHESQHYEADRDRLQHEIDNLLNLAASGVSAETVAPKVRERQQQLAKVDLALRTPRPTPPNIEKLREALEQRTASWKAELRAEPKIARLVLRRLVGPLTLWKEPARWQADTKIDDLIDGSSIMAQRHADHLPFDPRYCRRQLVAERDGKFLAVASWRRFRRGSPDILGHGARFQGGIDIGQRGHPSNLVLKLTNVPGPGIEQQMLHGFFGHTHLSF